MGVFYESIPNSLKEWILTQNMLFVATAPLSNTGHVNVSPKGGKCFGIVDERTFWYHDLTGSGSETIAHLHEPGNGRVTIMFCAFEGAPKIIRLWGKGRVLERGTPAFDAHVEQQKINLQYGTRSIIIVDVHQVGSSCGFSVPFYDFKEFRPVLDDFFEKKEKKFLQGNEKESMDQYWAFKSAYSMDGLPAMQRALEAGKKLDVAPMKKMIGPLAPKNGTRGGSDGFTLEQLVIVFITALVAGLMIMFAVYPKIEGVVGRQGKVQSGMPWSIRSLR